MQHKPWSLVQSQASVRIEQSGTAVYDSCMKRSRTLLILVLSIGVSVQPWASPPCSCGEHAEMAGMTASGSGDHEHGSHRADEMSAHDLSMHDSPDSNDCEATGTACKCGTCAHFVGLVFRSTEAGTMAAAPDQASLPHYVEPPIRRAFRPPIHI